MVARHIVLDFADLADDLLPFRDLFLYYSCILCSLGVQQDAKVVITTVDVVDDSGEDDRPPFEDGFEPERFIP